MENVYFHCWVANTISECGGNGTLYLQGLQRKLVPTYVEYGAGSCQDQNDSNKLTVYADCRMASQISTLFH